MINKSNPLTVVSTLLFALTGCMAPGSDEEAKADDAESEVGATEQALAGCFGNGCNGKDPSLCEADAYTVASTTIVGSAPSSKVAIRYSPSCRAAWTRTSTDYGTAYLRSEMTRAGFVTQAASPTPVAALRSFMVGALPGTQLTAVGRIGPQYGFYPYVGSLLANF